MKREHLALVGAGLYLVIFVAGALWAQWWSVRNSEQIHLPFVDISPWLPDVNEDYGSRIHEFAGPPTEEGLESAVEEQRAIVQTLEHEGYNMWSGPECAWWYSLRALAADEGILLRNVRIVSFDPAGSEVSMEFVERHDTSRRPFRISRTERWIHTGSVWRNTTCDYIVGPTLLEFLIENADVVPRRD